jgi:diguanylate cyclase (GGDEF)-like protein
LGDPRNSKAIEPPLQRFNLVRPQFFDFSESDASSLPGMVDAGRRSAAARRWTLAAWLGTWAVAAVTIVLASATVELSLVLLEVGVLTGALAVTSFLGLRAARIEAGTLSAYLWEMWRYNIRLEQSAARDSLTGLYDRAHFMHLLAEEFQRARDGGSSFSLLVMDLEDFAEINKRFGHDIGDRVMQAVAGRLSQTVRPGDLVARIGNDEFAILITDVRGEQAQQLAKRLSQAALAQPFVDPEKGDTRIQLRASFGVASCDPGHASPSHLMSEALARLHQQKSKQGTA